jgi:hypothetical protein
MDDILMSSLYSRSLADPLKKALDAVGVKE